MTEPVLQSQPVSDVLAEEVLASLSQGRQITPLTGRHDGLDLPDAYRVTAAVRRLREARGERVVGRKIGFTNRTIWDEYGVHAPIWGYVHDTTLHDLADLGGSFSLSGVVEPRIEPEIAFGLARAPDAGMSERDLLGCVAWVAHGFEVVQSLFPGWRFQAADTVAAFGLHGALLLGPRAKIEGSDIDLWYERLASFEITLLRDGVAADHGRASNVLGGGPLAALHHLVQVLAADRTAPPLAPGEVVTTGTLTRALPIRPSERWSTQPGAIDLGGIDVAFT